MPRANTLKARRFRARGIGSRIEQAWNSRRFNGLGNRATLTTALAGANNDLLMYAKVPGTGGNSITFRIVVAGNNTPLTVSVASSAITVNAATDGSAVATSTADQVASAVRYDSAAGSLVHIQRAPANDGSGVVVALGATSLTGAV